MRTFEKVKKRYVLNNSYFKNIGQEEPQRPIEVMGYVSQYSELPYREVMTDRWIYDCYVEYQKRCGVVLDQFFTPPAVAHQVYELAKICFDDSGSVLDAFCGFGMLSREMREEGFDVEGFNVETKEHFYHGGGHIENRHAMTEALVFNFELQDCHCIKQP